MKQASKTAVEENHPDWFAWESYTTIINFLFKDKLEVSWSGGNAEGFGTEFTHIASGTKYFLQIENRNEQNFLNRVNDAIVFNVALAVNGVSFGITSPDHFMFVLNNSMKTN